MADDYLVKDGNGAPQTFSAKDVGGKKVPRSVPSDETNTAYSGTNPLPTGDAGPIWTTVWGVAGLPFTSADQHSAVASVTDAPVTGKKIVVDDFIVSVDTAMSVTLKEETSGTVIAGPFYLPANSGPCQLTPRGKGWKLPTVNKKLQVITSIAGNIMVLAGYHSEA